MQGERQDQRLYAQKFSRTYLLILLLLAAILFFNILKIFLVPILLATVVTSMCYPLYEAAVKLLNGRKTAGAILSCVLLLLLMLVPIYAVAHMVALEGIDLFRSAGPKIQHIIEQGDKGLLGTIQNNAIVQLLGLHTIDWKASLKDVATNVGSVVTAVINKTSQGTFHVVTDLFITLFTMFYFFRDGQGLIARIKYLSPLDDIYEEGLIHRFVSVSRATIKGTLVIGLVQGTLGGLTLWICGVGSPILWAVVMVILSVIPLVGTWLVLYPAAIIQLLLGNVWQGIAIFLITTIVIGNIDNLLRPRLVGRDAGMHDLIIFFSTLGGISVFGMVGFIIGPVIAVFFLTILDIYSIEFKSTLDIAGKAELSPGLDT